MINLDLDVLRSFVTGMDLGSYARAAQQLGRSTSAVSAQLRKLEVQVGAPVLQKSGRGLVLTPTGEIVLAYARRLLELNDAALHAVRGARLKGRVRVGVVEDFGDHFLTSVLTRFAASHPGVSVEARVARNPELEQRVLAGELDVILSWGTDTPLPERLNVRTVPLYWIGRPGNSQDWAALPLVLMDAPCLMRSQALSALDRAGIPWRMAFTSTTLSAVWAAVRAGLGVTLRSILGCPPDLGPLAGLPELPDLQVCLTSRNHEPDPVSEAMLAILREELSLPPKRGV